jgi:hypothetical protein
MVLLKARPFAVGAAALALATFSLLNLGCMSWSEPRRDIFRREQALAESIIKGKPIPVRLTRASSLPIIVRELKQMGVQVALSPTVGKKAAAALIQVQIANRDTTDAKNALADLNLSEIRDAEIHMLESDRQTIYNTETFFNTLILDISMKNGSVVRFIGPTAYFQE